MKRDLDLLQPKFLSVKEAVRGSCPFLQSSPGPSPISSTRYHRMLEMPRTEKTSQGGMKNFLHILCIVFKSVIACESSQYYFVKLYTKYTLYHPGSFSPWTSKNTLIVCIPFSFCICSVNSINYDRFINSAV